MDSNQESKNVRNFRCPGFKRGFLRLSITCKKTSNIMTALRSGNEQQQENKSLQRERGTD